MFISVPAIVSQWVEVGSLTASSRNDAFSDNCVENIAKPVAVVKRIFKEIGLTQYAVFSSTNRCSSEKGLDLQETRARSEAIYRLSA